MFNFGYYNFPQKITQTPKEMKVAIPTEDGFTVNKQFAPNGSFLISTLQFGEVTEQEMRWTINGEVSSSSDGLYKKILDCDIVIVRDIEFNQRNFLQLHKIEVVNTDETIITKVLMNYFQTVLQKESDTCCCP